jgi:hypothetical protein
VWSACCFCCTSLWRMLMSGLLLLGVMIVSEMNSAARTGSLQVLVGTSMICV